CESGWQEGAFDGNGHGWKATFAKAGVAGSNPAESTHVSAGQRRFSGAAALPLGCWPSQTPPRPPMDQSRSPSMSTAHNEAMPGILLTGGEGDRRFCHFVAPGAPCPTNTVQAVVKQLAPSQLNPLERKLLDLAFG